MPQDWLQDGRTNQKRRTRRALIDAAVELTRRGATPTVAEAAEHAGISRATAYRYFPTQEALTIETAIEVVMPSMDRLFAQREDLAADLEGTAVHRVETVERTLVDIFFKAEAQVRTLIRSSMDLWLASRKGRNVTLRRQGRRMPMVDAALAPLEGRLDRTAHERLRAALAMVLGMESIVSLVDVVGLKDPDAVSDVRRWTVRALLQAALEETAE